MLATHATSQKWEKNVNMHLAKWQSGVDKQELSIWENKKAHNVPN